MNNPHQKAMVKLFEQCRYRHDIWSVWSDFCEMSALSISNSVDKSQWDAREARYLEIIGRYSKDEQALFPQMFGELVMAMDDNMRDILGATFMDLELGSKWKGQFFTPYELAHLMAKMTMNGMEDMITARDFITVMEPAVGAGVTILACAQAMKEAGFNYQRQMHVTAVDVDATCVHMCYVQLALHHIPAVVVHGNSLSLEEWGHWYTPAHIMGGWEYRLKAGKVHPVIDALETLGEFPEAPMELPVEMPAINLGEVRQLALF